MRLHRFYTEQLIGGEDAAIGANIVYVDTSKQWRKVFRFVSGDRVIIFNGTGIDFICEIRTFDGDTVRLVLIEKHINIAAPIRNVTLTMALVKKDTFEWVAEKATELGVSRIVPVIAERSEKKNLNIPRLRSIIIEATEQSGRGSVPVLEEIVTLADKLTRASLEKTSNNILAFDPTGQKYTEEIFSHAQLLEVLIGPEGGWSPTELALFKEKNIPIVSLGSQILRAETAVVAVLSRILL